VASKKIVSIVVENANMLRSAKYEIYIRNFAMDLALTNVFRVES
jgi:hypothetical protein